MRNVLKYLIGGFGDYCSIGTYAKESRYSSDPQDVISRCSDIVRKDIQAYKLGFILEEQLC